MGGQKSVKQLYQISQSKISAPVCKIENRQRASLLLRGDGQWDIEGPPPFWQVSASPANPTAASTHYPGKNYTQPFAERLWLLLPHKENHFAGYYCIGASVQHRDKGIWIVCFIEQHIPASDRWKRPKRADPANHKLGTSANYQEVPAGILGGDLAGGYHSL